MIRIVFYTPEHTSLVKEKLVQHLDDLFEGEEVHVSKGDRLAPCVLAVVTDTESEAFAKLPT